MQKYTATLSFVDTTKKKVEQATAPAVETATLEA